ncbi:MAG TPA: hypothetical protein VII66_04905 [Gemmatimonadaceae bacterium]
MSLSRYPKYKKSGEDWLGDVPEHWRVKRLRFVAQLNPSKAEVSGRRRDTVVSFLPMEAIGDDGTLILDHERTLGEVDSGYTYFREGDVAVAKITPCFENGKGAVMRGLVNGIGFGTTELVVARPYPAQLSASYLHYIFVSPDFLRLGEAHMFGAGGQKRVPDEFVRNFVTALPPLAEQTDIAAFLDGETAKIDRLVAEQRHLMEVLREKRRAIISHAVTKGFNQNAAMRQSGIDWIGRVPTHWREVRLRDLFRQEKRQDQTGNPVLSVYREFGVIRKDSRDDNMNKTPEDLSAYQLVNPGDLVVNKMKAWQGSLGISGLRGITSPDYLVFTPRHEERSEFLHLLLRSQRMVTIYRGISNGIRLAQWRLEPDAFLSLHVFLPPKEEQRELTSFVNVETSRFDALSAEAQRVIDLLLERRAALISAAITGAIDLRERINGGQP